MDNIPTGRRDKHKIKKRKTKRNSIYRNNKIQGLSTSYYENGNINSKLYYENGTLEELEILHENGNIKEKSNFITRIHDIFNEDGVLIESRRI